MVTQTGGENMQKKILGLSPIVLTLLIVSVASIGALAYYIDMAYSNDNTITAAGLDLQINEQDNYDKLFTVTNMAPEDTFTDACELANKGTITGYLNFAFTLKDIENDLTAPEVAAGDDTSDKGELSNFLTATMFIDYNHNGVFDGKDVLVYKGILANLPSSITVNAVLNASESEPLVYSFYWGKTPKDNLAMTDGVILNMAVSLSQTKQ